LCQTTTAELSSVVSVLGENIALLLRVADLLANCTFFSS